MVSLGMEETLPALLRQMLTDINDPGWHYMVSASYFDFLDSDRTQRRRYLNPIYVHQDSVWNAALDQTELQLDVLLVPDPGAKRERIHIGYDQIYSLARNRTGGMFAGADLLYRDMSRFSIPATR